MAEETLKLSGDPKGAVLRFAPNPNGRLTIGHARGVVVNNYLAKKYDGKFILRFDDTDPRTKRPLPEAYEWIVEDCKWLGAVPDQIVRASENIDTYYSYAKKLIGAGHAYVCTCEQMAFKTSKAQGLACPCRPKTPEENLAGWEAMLSTTCEGEAVLRIKTDMSHDDPALRDWTAFRIIESDHPLTGDKYRVWPLLDFESAIEDHLRGVTHIIRGIDLLDSGLKQKFLYGYLGWEYPETILWGRLKIEDIGKFSTSQMAADIASGKFTGWDDPALPTLAAFRRRGIHPDSITEFMVSLGLSASAITISLDNLYSINRKRLDEKVNRYFFIADPTKLFVTGIPGKTIRMPLHPGFKERGVREQCMQDGSCLYISKKDSEMAAGEIVKLMGLPCIEVESVDADGIKAKYVPGRHKKTKKIQCVQNYVTCRLLRPDGVDEGYCEPQVAELPIGTVVQFERYGFARLEAKGDDLTFVFAHN